MRAKKLPGGLVAIGDAWASISAFTRHLEIARGLPGPTHTRRARRALSDLLQQET
jgi:hypothetical protein